MTPKNFLRYLNSFVFPDFSNNKCTIKRNCYRVMMVYCWVRSFDTHRLGEKMKIPYRPSQSGLLFSTFLSVRRYKRWWEIKRISQTSFQKQSKERGVGETEQAFREEAYIQHYSKWCFRNAPDFWKLSSKFFLFCCLRTGINKL